MNLKSKGFEELSKSDSKVLYTYDTQSENNDKLGMAILGSASELGTSGKTVDVATGIKNTYYIPLKISTDKTSDFRFYACWERSDKRFASASQFRDFLEFEALKYIQPIRVK